jgi:small basic protein
LTISPEIAWIVPIIIPLVIGLVVGLIMKHALKLMFAIAVLAVLLVVFGAVSLTYQDIFDQALKVLPRIIGTGNGFVDVLPYSSLTFLIGLGLGLWRG